MSITNNGLKSLALGLCLCCIVSLEATVLKWVKTEQEVDPPSEQLVLLTEILKTVLSYIFFILHRNRHILKVHRQSRDEETNAQDEHSPLLLPEPSRSAVPDSIHDHETRRVTFRTPSRHRRSYSLGASTGSSRSTRSTFTEVEETEALPMPVTTNSTRKMSSTLFFIVPALLYTVSNNVTYLALSHLSSAMFTLLMNLKIPITGLVAWATLHKDMTRVQWVALLVMFLASVLATLRFSSENGGSINLNCSLIGLGLMILYSTCSASAAVFMEYITRFRFKTENILLQNVKFGMYGVASNTAIALYRGTFWSWNIEAIHFLSIFAMVINGFMTSAVLKYAGSIVKTYAVSFASILSALLALVIWHIFLPWNFWLGLVLSVLAINLYAFDKARVITLE